MTNDDAPQLLDCRDVVMGSESGQGICLDAQVAPLLWPYPALRVYGTHRDEVLPVNRVPAAQRPAELCAGVSRDVSCDALQVGSSSPASEQGVGNG